MKSAPELAKIYSVVSLERGQFPPKFLQKNTP